MTPLILIIALFLLLSIIAIVVVLSVDYDKDKEKNKEKKNKAIQITGIVIGSIAILGLLVILFVKLYMSSLIEDEKKMVNYPRMFADRESSPRSSSSMRREIDKKVLSIKDQLRDKSSSPPTFSERRDVFISSSPYRKNPLRKKSSPNKEITFIPRPTTRDLENDFDRQFVFRNPYQV